MPIPLVIDLSHHNVIPESLKPASDDGIIGCIHKCTEGGSYIDKKVAARFALARDAGLMWGVYHFLRPGSMEQQARFFVEQAKPVTDENSIFVADHEDAGVSLQSLQQFLKVVESLTGRVPVIYSGHVLKEQLAKATASWVYRYPLWLCHYTSSKPVLPKGFEDYWLWQYTDQGDCAGINSPVDLNAISISLDEFTATWPMRPEDVGEDPEDDVDPDEVEEVTTTIRIRSKGPVKVEVVEE